MAVLVMAVGGALVVLIPELLGAWLYPPSEYPPAARTDWIDSLRTGLLGVLAFGSVAAWVTQYRQAVMARTVEEYNDRLRQLSQGTWEQVAGIRDLEDLARKNDELQIKTLQMLAVYVRDKAPRTEALNDVSTTKLDKGGPKGKRRPKPGVQEALRVIGSHLTKWAPQPDKTKEDVEDAWKDARIGESNEVEALASVTAGSLQDYYVSLADIAIDGAVLRGAQLRGLNLRRTLMRDVKLERANLSGARLRDAVLTDADLRGVDLRGADLHGADLTRANVEGAHLWGAVGLSHRPGQTIGKPHCEPGGPECREGAAMGGKAEEVRQGL